MSASRDGATLIAITISGALLGLNGAQSCFYFWNYATDHKYLRLLVISVLVCDAIHQTLICHWMYTTLITSRFGNSAADRSPVWSILFSSLVNHITILMTQCFLILRVRAMCRTNGISSWFAGIPLALVMAEFVSNLVFFFKARLLHGMGSLASLQNVIIVADVTGAVADILIGVSLCVLFHTARSGISKTNAVINTLMVLSLNTGLLTALCSTGSLISLLVAPDTFIYSALFFNLGRIHTNAMLAVLNARQSFRRMLAEPDLSLSPINTSITLV